MFSVYPWLNTLVDTSNCFEDNYVETYTQGIYTYLFVQSNGEGKLYFQDGTFYCSSTPTFDCLAAYYLEIPSRDWKCGANQEPVEEEEEEEEEETELFVQYPWLNEIVDLSTCAATGTIITEYIQGNYVFISVLTNNESTLYFQDGTKYCTDGIGLNCVAAYNLSEVGNSYQCSSEINSFQGNLITSRPTNTDWSISPNPSHGWINLKINNPLTTMLKVSIFNLQGKEIFNQPILSQQSNYTFDVMDYEDGTYFLTLQFEDYLETQKIMIIN